MSAGPSARVCGCAARLSPQACAFVDAQEIPINSPFSGFSPYYYYVLIFAIRRLRGRSESADARSDFARPRTVDFRLEEGSAAPPRSGRCLVSTLCWRA